MRARTVLERSLVGPAGEHFVLYRLYRMGLMAGFPPPGAPYVDILVLSPDERVVASLQVKTRTYGRDQGWHMRRKHEGISAPHMLYVFVDLEPDPPVTYVVPSAVVADVLRKSHVAWLKAPGVGGRAHQDHEMRRVMPDYGHPVEDYEPGWLNQYRERWDLVSKAAQPVKPS